MKEKPTENRIMTGSDKEMSAEQAGNMIKDPKFALVQKNRIKGILASTVAPSIEAFRRRRKMFESIDLIQHTKDGVLMSIILKCRYEGYSYKKIAKVMMKSEINTPHFTSLTKAIKFVKDCEKEGKHRAKTELQKKKIITL